ncbi:MAG TPA: hypothetical protein VJ826_16480 [Candidatus Polarisedimenticolaceae bacterium]|nr:hypothetical protein [Candidatus Polarisedimenticolaceae bacterium]
MVAVRILLAALLCPAPALASSYRFAFERFTIPDDGQIIGNGINNAGDVAGVVDDFATGSLKRLGFVRRGADVLLIDFPGTDDLNGTVANGIDDAGRVVGRFTVAPLGSRTHGFIMQGEQAESFDVPGSSFTEASDINNHGVVVGRTFLGAGLDIGTAFVRTGDQYSFFRPPDALGPFGSAFYGINDDGDTVGEVLSATGFQGFAILDGVYMPFTIPGSYLTFAHGINDADQIVGWYYDGQEVGLIHGFLMDFSGVYRIDVPAEGSYGTFIAGINDEGSIVGSVGFHRFPAQEAVVGSPCAEGDDACVTAPRIGDPLIDFTLRVGVDVRPGTATNPVHPAAGGVIPVALLGSANFHVADVDQATLALGPLGAAPQHAHAVDVNDDGALDLLVQFRTGESGIGAGDTEVCMTGALLSGRPFRGCDAIRTVPGTRNHQVPIDRGFLNSPSRQAAALRGMDSK